MPSWAEIFAEICGPALFQPAWAAPEGRACACRTNLALAIWHGAASLLLSDVQDKPRIV